MYVAKRILTNLVAGAHMNVSLFSTTVNENALSQCIFAKFASTILNMSATDITQMLGAYPTLRRLKNLHNVEQLVDMLNIHGCTKADIANIIRVQPSLMLTNTERILEPKIKSLEHFGIQGQNLAKILTAEPRILATSLKEDLPKMEFLKTIFQSQDLLVRSLVRVPMILINDLKKTLEPSVAFWNEWGFQGVGLTRFVVIRPQVLLCTSLTPAQVDLINQIGGDKSCEMFKHIVSEVAVTPMETLQAKIENLKLYGQTSSEVIWQLIRAAPFVLYYSKETVSYKMNFLVNNMELPANYVVKHPWLLSIKVERTLRPRYLVFQKIKSFNEHFYPLSTVLRMSEAAFINKVIKGHPESETLWAIYENAISNVSNRIEKRLH